MSSTRSIVIIFTLWFLSFLGIVHEFWLTDELKRDVYKFFYCGQCPHTELQEQIVAWSIKIQTLKLQYPQVEQLIKQKEQNNEKCWQNLEQIKQGKIAIAQQQLQYCHDTMRQMLVQLNKFEQQQIETQDL